MRLPLQSRAWLAALCLLSGALAAQEADTVLSAKQTEAIQAQIRRLNAEDLVEREDAERELLRIGTPALPLIKEATKAGEPEIAARAKKLQAKLTELATIPAQSYAEIMPANSVLFGEIPNSRETLDKLKGGPFGKFWQLPATCKAYKGHYDAQMADDQKILDIFGAVGKLADGKVLFALGSPDTAEVTELDPPFIYVLESKQPQALEARLRALFDATGDPPRGAPRAFGPFTILEHITAQTVFGQEGMSHSLTQKGIESFLENRLKPPGKTLTPVLAEVRALMPQYDALLHLSADGFAQLANAGQLLDDEQLKLLDALGFVAGSSWQSVLALNDDGVEEQMLLKIGGGANNEGLLAVFKQMAGSVPPPPAHGLPDALDLIPWQAGILISFNGEVATHAAALSKALRALDSNTVPAPKALKVPPQLAGKLPQAKQPPPAPPENAPPEKPKPEEAGAAPPKAPGHEAKDEPPAGGEVKGPPQAVCPRVARIEKIGLKLEQLCEQVQGPVQVALFLRQVGKEAPQSYPIAPLVAVVLKEPGIVQQALEAASVEPQPRFKKEALNGGLAYLETSGDPEKKPGFWLKGSYLAYAAEHDLLDLAGIALAHAKGMERFADRLSYKKALAAQRLERTALLTVWGDADQVLEMPYNLARVAWEDDPDAPWPEYALLKPFLQGKPVMLQAKAMPDGLQVKAQTPLSVIGTCLAFRLPLKEAGF